MEEVKSAAKQTREQILENAKTKQWGKILLPTGIPALDEAVRLEKINLVEPIMAGDYDLALRRAIYYKNKTMVLPILPHVKNIHAPSASLNGQCALHFASRHGMDDVVKLLIEYGAYIDIVDKQANTPLHLACKSNHASTATLLLESGAIFDPHNINDQPGMLFTDHHAQAECDDSFSLAEWKFRGKRFLPSLTDSGLDWVGDGSQVKLLAFKKGDRESVIKKEIIAKAKIKCLSAADLIQIEKSHKAVLHHPITAVLNAGEGHEYVNITSAKLEEYNKLAEKILKLEKALGCEFKVIFSDVAAGKYFLKSKTPVTSEICGKLGDKFYKLSSSNCPELLIHGHNLDCCIVSSERNNQFNLLKLLTNKIGFNAKWNIDKNDAAWCYVPEDKIAILEKYNLSPIMLKKTQDKKHILMLKEISKQDLPILIPSLIQKIQLTTTSSQTNRFGIFDHSQSELERASALPKRKIFKISITDIHGKLYNELEPDSKDATPAQYFAAWVYKAVESLNGGHGLGEKMKMVPELAPQMIATEFLCKLYEHPYFSAEKMRNKNDLNHQCLLEMDHLLTLNQGFEVVAKWLTTFKVPGITVNIECVDANLTKEPNQLGFKFGKTH